jgi:hypothetical protein
MDQAEYTRKYEEYVKAFDAFRGERGTLNNGIAQRKTMKTGIEEFMDVLQRQKAPVVEFSERLWRAVVDKLIVINGHRMVFHFKDGTEAAWEM